MVKIPYIKIPSVRVGSIGPTSNIGAGATPAPPTPITYLTQWKIVGNSEVHTLPYPDGVVLPNGYKRCEYLQSDAVAYIEVPFGFYKTDEVYAKVAVLDITHIDKYFVSPKVWNTAENRFAMGVHRHAKELNNPYWCCAYGDAATSATFLEPHTAPDISEHIWQYKNYKFTLDDGSLAKEINKYHFGNETDNLRLFYGYNTPTECKICEYRHKKANAEYRLIPCLDSSNVPCMYDVINNQAYYNSAGSGSFTYKLYSQPTEIWSCGEYSDVDNKYHIVVLPTGKQAVNIVLDEPLRKTGNTADTLEYPTEISGKALLTIRVKESGGELSPLDTPTTELVDAPQIEEAESYTCVISQGGKAVSWSSFETNSE